MSVMTHVVVGYPSEKDCIELMRGMEKVGVSMIEVQIPFSDPIADGETIMQANDVALSRGMTTEKSFGLIAEAGLKIDVYVMSYFQKISHFGLDEFCSSAAKVGVKGLIVPDLPYDAPDFDEFLEAIKRHDLVYIPVISEGMSDGRLEKSLAAGEDLIYLTSMRGITGKNLKITDELAAAAKKVKQIKPKSTLAIGFGISTREDLEKILKIADIGVVGSAVIRKIDQQGIKSALKFVREL